MRSTEESSPGVLGRALSFIVVVVEGARETVLCGTLKVEPSRQSPSGISCRMGSESEYEGTGTGFLDVMLKLRPLKGGDGGSVAA